MASISSFIVFFLLFSNFAAGADDSNTTSPAILLTVCSQNQTQNPQAFDVNFVNSMELIYQNITKNGFGVSFSGTSNTVYGLGQCFDYLTDVNCQLCYAQSRVKLPHCLPSSSARIYLDGCFLRYADFNVSDEALDSSDQTLCSNSSVDPSNSAQFAQVAGTLVSKLTVEAANVIDYYAAESADVSPKLKVYAMAQCWRSLNNSGCRECLTSANETLAKCFPIASDGKALNAGCFVRYSSTPFYLPKTTGGGGGSSGWKVSVALASAFAAILVVIAMVIIVSRRRRRAAMYSEDDDDESRAYIRSISRSHLAFQYEDLRKATNDFDQINKIGQGGYGTVYKGVLRDGREVAVKRLFFNTRQRVDQFFNEVTLISQVQHKNLVKLLGCSVEGPESLLVYEYLPNTSLDRFLFDSFKKGALDWARRYEIIVGTAEGLAYLHGASEVRIIHRDIKASNVLLDERFRPKIADFGLARNFADDRSHLSTGLAGTLGYMAPEYIVHGQLTEKADVYSYGILLMEIVTGRKNQTSIATSSDGHSLTTLIWTHFTGGSVIDLVDPILRGQCDDDMAVKVFHVGLLCMQASPSARPPMWKVVEMLSINSNKSDQQLPFPSEPPFLNVKGATLRDSYSNSQGSADVSIPGSSSSKYPANSINQMSASFLQAR